MPSRPDPPVSRRKLLSAITTGGVASLAGCSCPTAEDASVTRDHATGDGILNAKLQRVDSSSTLGICVSSATPVVNVSVTGTVDSVALLNAQRTVKHKQVPPGASAVEFSVWFSGTFTVVARSEFGVEGRRRFSVLRSTKRPTATNTTNAQASISGSGGYISRADIRWSTDNKTSVDLFMPKLPKTWPRGVSIIGPDGTARLTDEVPLGCSRISFQRKTSKIAGTYNAVLLDSAPSTEDAEELGTAEFSVEVPKN